MGENRAIVGGRHGDGLPIAELASGLQRAQPVAKDDLRDQALARRGECPLMEVRPVGRGRADDQGVVEERQRLLVGAERCGSLCSAAQRDPGLGRERIGLRALGRVAQGGQVVTSQGAGQLVGPERLEEPGRREVPRLAIPRVPACCRRPPG